MSNVNFANKFGNTPLINAVQRGNLNVQTNKIVKFSNTTDFICLGDEKIVDFLIQNGASIESSNEQGLTPLNLAAKLGNFVNEFDLVLRDLRLYLSVE